MIDNNQADDKIIAVLKDDAVYGAMTDISECPEPVVERLKHYFLTYKDLPNTKLDVEITHTYNSDEAKEVIRRTIEDYRIKFENLDSLLSSV